MNVFIDFFQNNALSLITTLGVAIGWMFDRKRRRAEINQINTSATELIQNAYAKYVADDQQRYDKLNERLMEQEKRIATLVKEREELRDKNQEYERKIKSLEKQVSTLQKELSLYKIDKQ